MDSLNLCFPVRIPKASFLECDITIGNIIITEKHTPVWKKAEVSGELQRKYRRSIKGMWRWKLRMLREVMGKYSCAIYWTNRKLYGENYSEHKSSECSNEGCENEAWIHRKTDFLNAIIHIFAPLKWQNSKASMSSFFFYYCTGLLQYGSSWRRMDSYTAPRRREFGFPKRLERIQNGKVKNME